MQIFVIYDRKAQRIRSLFSAESKTAAIRAAVGAAKSGAGDLSSYPHEFELRLIADVEEVSAEILPKVVPELIGTVASLLDAAGVNVVEPPAS